jgi:hypothetical protein
VHAVAGTQAAQEAGPLANVPTGHVADVNAQEMAPAVLNAPAAQVRHAAAELAPVAGEYLPAGQLVQEVAPMLLKVPAGHNEHVVPNTKVGHKSQ